MGLLITCLAAAQTTMPADFATDVETKAVPWTSLEFPPEDDFEFVVMADRTGGKRAEVFREATEKINRMRPDFVICVGDLIPGYTEKPEEVAKMRAELEKELAAYEVPFFYVAGNHDFTNKTMAGLYKERFGRSYYHFVYKNTLFVVLNTEESLRETGQDDFDPAQVDYLKKTLEENNDVRWTFVFFHKPLWENTPAPENWLKIDEMLKQRDCTVFAGHNHRYVHYSRNGRDFIRLSTTGGGSGIMGADVGHFDGFAWIAMDGNEPQITNLDLKGIHDKSVFTEQQEKYAFPMRDTKWLKIDGIVTDEKTFESGKAVISLQNIVDVPLKFAVSFEEHAQLEPAPAISEIVVAPGETKELAVSVKSKNGSVAIADLVPLDLTIEVMTQGDGEPVLVTRRIRSLEIGPKKEEATRPSTQPASMPH